jgi:hypothetical protein
MFAFLASLSVFTIVVIFVVAFVIHFLPAFIAGSRHVRSFWWIVLINIFLGWTFIGWVVALVWALRDEPAFVRPYMQAPPPQF